MKHLNEIKKDSDLIYSIDWDMTPEEAVRLFLEWGNNWARGNYVIRSKDDVAYYFVINTWYGQPKLFLIKRNSEDANELAEIEIPGKLEQRFLDSIGHNKGVFAINDEIKDWLKGKLYED